MINVNVNGILNVNGISHRLNVSPDMPLLCALRDHLQLAGTKFGGGEPFCGACTVYRHGKPESPCSVKVVSAMGRPLTTIEGRTGPVIDALRSARADLDMPQCGYCHCSQLMRAEVLHAAHRQPYRVTGC